ncbi:hypothetical protein DIPPA_01219 [Diplonema papillatum]|nr:hypothetical protein DIPPA_25848 [Diplonema papillatum]KAJ9446816.1 hypothetical protein DIPPA_01219 [Diplonema papillatum]
MLTDVVLVAARQASASREGSPSSSPFRRGRRERGVPQQQQQQQAAQRSGSHLSPARGGENVSPTAGSLRGKPGFEQVFWAEPTATVSLWAERRRAALEADPAARDEDEGFLLPCTAVPTVQGLTLRNPFPEWAGRLSQYPVGAFEYRIVPPGGPPRARSPGPQFLPAEAARLTEEVPACAGLATRHVCLTTHPCVAARRHAPQAGGASFVQRPRAGVPLQWGVAVFPSGAVFLLGRVAPLATVPEAAHAGHDCVRVSVAPDDRTVRVAINSRVVYVSAPGLCPADAVPQLRAYAASAAGWGIAALPCHR